MRSPCKYLTFVDDGTKAMSELIKTCGKGPVSPDAFNGQAYKANSLGKLGEQYVGCLFKEMDINKLPETTKTSPDYELNINRKKIILEVKTGSNLFTTFPAFLFEIFEEESDSNILNKLRYLVENYDFNVPSADIHREGKRKRKEEFIKVLKELKSPKERTSFSIVCGVEKSKKGVKEYKILLTLKHCKSKADPLLFTGFQPDEIRPLVNTIRDNIEQIELSDIFLFISLRTIDINDLLKLFYYRPGSVFFQPMHEISVKPQFPSITQKRYEKTIWRKQFPDRKGQFHTMDKQVKCIIVIYPHTKMSLVFPSIKNFGNFAVPEYRCLKEILKKEFECYWTTSRG